MNTQQKDFQEYPDINSKSDFPNNEKKQEFQGIAEWLKDEPPMPPMQQMPQQIEKETKVKQESSWESRESFFFEPKMQGMMGQWPPMGMQQMGQFPMGMTQNYPFWNLMSQMQQNEWNP